MGCVNTIEAKVAVLPGVKSARFILSAGRLKLERNSDFDPKMVIPLLKNLGYSAVETSEHLEPQEENKLLLKKLAAAAFGAANVMLFSLAVWTGTPNGMGAGTVTLFGWLSALIALPVITYSGTPFFSSALRAVKARQINMDVPITLALLLTTGMSLYQLIGQKSETYFEAATTLIFFLLIGRYLDKTARSRTKASIEGLLAFTKLQALVVTKDGEHITLPATELKVGMTVLVKAGAHIPSDGIVLSGVSDIDTSPITGETIPATVSEGHNVYGGTLNVMAPLTVRVDVEPSESLASKTIHLMQVAEQRRTKYIQLANRAAGLYAPIVHALAALAFLGWWLGGGLTWQDALLTAVSVLIITCPCALGLAVPVVQIVANSRLFAAGILQKSADGLERLCNVSHIVFDKTGTLTTGNFTLVNKADIKPEVLSVAWAVANLSTHPLCKTIVKETEPSAPVKLTDFKEYPGLGVRAYHEGHHIRFGNRSFCSVVEESQDTYSEAFLLIDQAKPIRFVFKEELRPDAKKTIEFLKSRGISLAISSGDRPEAVRAVAGALGVKDWFAKQLPTDKAHLITRGSKLGQKILMIGDGLNDGPAVSGAYVSMAPASGLDVTTSRADLVFRNKSLSSIAYAISVARGAKALMLQNLWLALLYNMIAVPLAVAGFASPPVAAVAMSLSSVFVTANALRLRNQL